MCVSVLVFVSVKVVLIRVRACVRAHMHALCCSVIGWDGGSLERMFVCVCHLQQSAPFTCDGLFVRQT